MMSDTLHTLARDSVLRVAINTGNRALVQQQGATLSGVAPALAARLARQINAKMQPVIYEGAGKVFADADADVWDVGFLAIDALRAQKISFTRPYLTIEATLAVRAGSDIHDVDDIDRTGTNILTSAGSAYDMYLTNTLQSAQLERSGTPPESFAAFQTGHHDAVAGVRASLEAFFADDPNVRILPGALTSVRQAMVLPRSDNPLIDHLDEFVARALDDGFITDHL